MPKITYIEHNGKEHTVEVPAGWTVMEGAVKNRVPGIDADCGGACACATCHVYADPAWLEKLPTRPDMESQMLDFALDVKPNSRRPPCATASTPKNSAPLQPSPRTGRQAGYFWRLPPVTIIWPIAWKPSS